MAGVNRSGLSVGGALLRRGGGVLRAGTAAGGCAESLQKGERALKMAGEMAQRAAGAYRLVQMAMRLGPRGEHARALGVTQPCLAIADDIEHRQWLSAGHRALGARYL